MTVCAAALDRRVELLRQVKTRNSQHEEVITYTSFATVWASKKDLRGSEYFAAQQLTARAETKFRIRWRTDLTVVDRILCEGVTYNIRHIAEIGRREGLEIMCSAQVPQ